MHTGRRNILSCSGNALLTEEIALTSWKDINDIVSLLQSWHKRAKKQNKTISQSYLVLKKAPLKYMQPQAWAPYCRLHSSLKSWWDGQLGRHWKNCRSYTKNVLRVTPTLQQGEAFAALWAFSCFSHCCDKILHKSILRKSGLCWLMAWGYSLS